MEEVRAAVTAMHPVLVLATLLRDRSDAAVLLDGKGVGVTGTFAAKGAGEPGCESRSSAGEALPERGIAIAGEGLLDLPVLLFEGKAELE